MAKKLSSRELAAKKAGGTLNYKTGAVVKPQLKVATKPTLSSLKSAAGASAGYTGIKTGNSMTPQQIAYQRGLDKQYNASPQSKIDSSIYAAKGIRAESESSNSGGGNTNRSQAKKAFDYSTAKSTPNSGLTGAGNTTFGGGAKTNISTALSSGGIVRGGGAKSLPGGGKPGIFERLFSTISEGQAGMAKGRSMAADEGAYNTPDQLAENRQQMQSIINSGIGVSNALANDIDGIQEDSQPFDYSTARSNEGNSNDPFDYSTARSNEGNSNDNGAYSVPGQSSALDDIAGGNQGYNQGDNGNQSYDNGAYSVPGQSSALADIAAALGTNPADTPIEDNPGGTVQNRSGRGSGAFGTGKGIQSDDPYIKELRKAYSNNGGEKWLRKQFDELIAALDPTYAQMQKEGTDALNSQLNEQNTKLASVMNAGNVGDSEQRSQLMAQQQQGSQTALGNLLAKLSQSKAQDVSGYKSQMAGKMSEYQQNQQTNAQKLQEAIRNYKNDKYDQEYKNASLSQKGGSQKNMSLKAIGFDKFGTENMWVDQSTGDIYDNSDFQQ